MKTCCSRLAQSPKVFTAILLSKLSLDGIIGLDAPVREHLPGFANLPDWITPRALSAHASGLPRIPDGIDIAFRSIFDKAISEDALKYLWRPSLLKPLPGAFAYSNLGVGRCVSRRQGARDGLPNGALKGVSAAWPQ